MRSGHQRIPLLLSLPDEGDCRAAGHTSGADFVFWRAIS